jgi:hemerythrin
MGFGYSITDLATEIKETGWTKKIETGVDILDSQHRQYFRFVNDYLTTAAKVTTNEDKNSELVKRLDFLRLYAIEHFATEQKIMQDAVYEGYQRHLEEHMYFLKHVEDLYEQVSNEGNNDRLTRELHFYTLEWFISHIQFTDMKMVAFLNEIADQ